MGRVRIIGQRGGGFESIIMWPGALGDIPAGWRVCDGTNGTPDLRDRFVRLDSDPIYGYGVNHSGGSYDHTWTHYHRGQEFEARQDDGLHDHNYAGFSWSSYYDTFGSSIGTGVNAGKAHAHTTPSGVSPYSYDGTVSPEVYPGGHRHSTKDGQQSGTASHDVTVVPNYRALYYIKGKLDLSTLLYDPAGHGGASIYYDCDPSLLPFDPLTYEGSIEDWMDAGEYHVGRGTAFNSQPCGGNNMQDFTRWTPHYHADWNLDNESSHQHTMDLATSYVDLPGDSVDSAASLFSALKAHHRHTVVSTSAAPNSAHAHTVKHDPLFGGRTYPDYTLWSGSREPPFYTLGHAVMWPDDLTPYVPWTGGGLPFPVGGICWWQGSPTYWASYLGFFPANGYAICDGSGGTPDLRDRMVIGAGGSLSPGDSGGVTAYTVAGHDHTINTLAFLASATAYNGGHGHGYLPDHWDAVVTSDTAGGTDPGVSGAISTYDGALHNHDAHIMLTGAAHGHANLGTDIGSADAVDINPLPYSWVRYAIMRVS